MNVEASLQKHLQTYSSLIPLIGNKVYPLVLPANTVFPAITFQKISGNRFHSLNGDTGITNPVYQISCYATSYASVKTIADYVRLSLQNFKGMLGGTGGVNIQSVLLISENEGYENDTKVYYVKYDFQLFYIESVN